MSAADVDRAWSWVEHLRNGGTTPWARWRDGGAVGARGPDAPALPGAQQLELLRRINELDPSGTRAPRLADRMLAASAFGRGRGDLPLVGAASSRFGPPAVDPAALPAGELLRVATLLLADDLAARPASDAAAGPGAGGAAEPAPTSAPSTARVGASGRRRVARRGWRLVGDPWVADQVRAAMRARGHRPGGRRSLVHVVAGPVDRLLADAWTHRCLLGPELPWADWVARHGGAAGTGLPAGADVAGTAETWARRVGPGRVVVVTDPAALPRLLGVRGLPSPVELGPEAVELARLVSIALDVVVDPRRRPRVLRGVLLPALVAHQGPLRALRLPAAHRDAVRLRSERQRDRVRRAGYAVRGDVDDLLVEPVRPAAEESPETGRGPAGPDPDGVLDLAGRLLLAGDRPEVGGVPR